MEWIGFALAHIALRGEKSVLTPVGYGLFLAGFFLTTVDLPRPSLARVLLALSVGSILVTFMMLRLIGILTVVCLSLLVVFRSSGWLSRVRRSFLPWFQTIKQLHAASKQT